MSAPLPSSEFGPFSGRAWLNAAHQGPLPRAAVAEAQRAIALKASPYLLTPDEFIETPGRLRSALGRLLDVPPEQVVLGNSASYGLHLIANGLGFEQGDEVLVPRGEFPATVTPWAILLRHGVAVRRLDSSAAGLIEPDELEEALGEHTRLACVSWVNSFSGAANDLAALGEVCRRHDVIFVVNATQGLGALPLRPASLPVDAIVSSGFKWLCGPYGTGLCWLLPSLRERLDPRRCYWLEHAWDRDPAAEVELEDLVIDPMHERAFDVFGTANFLNYMPWAASVSHLLDAGIDAIAAHDRGLVARFAAGLGADRFETHPTNSAILSVSHRDPARNERIHTELKGAGIDTAWRAGRIRFAPHLYNTEAEVDRALGVLESQ